MRHIFLKDGKLLVLETERKPRFVISLTALLPWSLDVIGKLQVADVSQTD